MRLDLTMVFVLVLRTTTTICQARSSAIPTAVARSSSSSSSHKTRRSSALFLQRLSNSLFSSSSNSRRTSSSMSSSDTKFYTIGITGASGLIGTALQDELQKTTTIDGKPIRIITLTRGDQAEEESSNTESTKPTTTMTTTTKSLVWNPNGQTPEEVISLHALNEMDALVHLSGENISTGLSGPLAPLGIRPWTDAKKQEILDSRTVTTTALAKAIAANAKPLDFLVASGVGAYGSHFVGDNAPPSADESSDISETDGFLAEVSRQWEGCTAEAKASGSRVVSLRNGVVLSTHGGAMGKLYPIFYLGGGGVVGSGKQYFPYISARDMARAMVHVLKTPSLEGPVNMCAPGGCTNAAFTAAMGKVLRRPTILPFPGFAVSLLFGEMGEEVLLGGTRAQPKKLLESGFEFLHPTVETAVQSAVEETI